MPTQVVSTNGTTQLKFGPGYITRITVVSAGSAWTLQLKDGPIGPTNSANVVIGSTPFTIAAIANPFQANQVLYFPNGIQVITAGTTPGEIDLDWN